MPPSPAAARASAHDPRDLARHIARLTSRGVTSAALERALALSPGYLSKLRHARVTPSPQLSLLLSLLACHPSLLAESGIVVERAPAPPLPTDERLAPAAPADGHALPFVVAIAPRLDAAGVSWAIGGGQAMNAYGLTRPTADVDLFIHDADRRALQIFRDAGASPDLVSSTSFLCFPGGRHHPADRIDIVFPTLLPACDAPARPTRRRLRGHELPFLEPADLFVAKLIAHGRHDEDDARALLGAGLVSLDAARRALAAVERLPKTASRYVTFHHDRALGRERLQRLRVERRAARRTR
jgi:hypothetical protein